MKRLLTSLLLTAGIMAGAAIPAPPRLETALPVIARWDFKDRSLTAEGGKFPMTLRGASTLVPAGDGFALAVNPENGDNPPISGMMTDKVYRELTPEGGFRLLMSFYPDARQYTRDSVRSVSTLIDSKYVNGDDPKYQCGFMVTLEFDGYTFRPVGWFGIHGGTGRVAGKSIVLEPDRWHVLELNFDGAGMVGFKLDGREAGSGQIAAGALAPAIEHLTIGDRRGSGYRPFAGWIGGILLAELPRRELAVIATPTVRRVYAYGEPAAKLHVAAVNSGKIVRDGMTAAVRIEGLEAPPSTTAVPRLGAGESARLELPLETRIAPGIRTLLVTLYDNAQQQLAEDRIEFVVMPPRLPGISRFLWGGVAPETARELGFTEQFCPITPRSEPMDDAWRIYRLNDLDAGARVGLYGWDSVSPAYRFERREKRHNIVGRDGNPQARWNLDASDPAVTAEYVELLEPAIREMASHPALSGALLNSEYPASRQPNFAAHETEAFRKFAGYAVPAGVSGQTMPWTQVPDFPLSRVLPDNDPNLIYYRWFWIVGSGWETLNSRLAELYAANAPEDFRTYHDPATRCPPYWRADDRVRLIGNWTYTYPDPVKIGQTTDELLALAGGRQKVLSMIQAIYYRSQIAPQNFTPPRPPEWLAREPKAEYITIPPDAMREALWCVLARKIDAIGVHGSGSLIAPERGAYRYTNAEAKEAFRDTVATVIEPLGPMLLEVPERKPEIAILQSFTNTIFAPGQHPFGWGKGWNADLHLALEYAGWQPSVMYEEHLFRGDADGLKILFIPGLEVVHESLLKKLEGLQSRGVILVGDEFTCPALLPDWRIQSVARRNSDPVGSKQALQRLGQSLKTDLAQIYRPAQAASNPDLIVRRRGSDNADYIFVINDKRTFGDYIGQWGLMMEKGVPNSGRVAVAHAAGAAYDLVRHRPLELDSHDGKTHFKVDLAPGDGMIALLLPEALGDWKFSGPATARRGETLTVTVSAALASGRPATDAVLPFELVLTDSKGRRMPGSGFYAAPGGSREIALPIPCDAAPGAGEITLHCLTAGKKFVFPISIP